ncbi:MAG: hypothetical protein KC609_19475 [Myxococcales bacterium]|nr:hypothetical protein [Myxococcales bacterium]
MARLKVIALTQSVRTKKLLQRVVTATGCNLEFDAAPAAVTDAHSLVIWDFPIATPPTLNDLKRLKLQKPILVLVQGHDLSQVMELWSDGRVGHILAYRDEDLDEHELIVSITKLTKGDIFGLQKYFTWGVTLFSMKVFNYQEKAAAISYIDEAAKDSGARGQLRRKIQLAADELLINALYHAPVDESGREIFGEKTGDERVAVTLKEPVTLRYATDGRGFAIAIRDAYGSLSRKRLLTYLQRSSDTKADMETKKTGAGLGLHEVLRSASSIAWNLSPGAQTEVICLFDMEKVARGLGTTQSISIFEETPNEPTEQASASSASEGASRAMTRLLGVAAVFIIILLAAGALMFLRKSAPTRVTVESDLPNATHLLNGSATTPPFVVDPKKGREQVITVKLRGNEIWSATLRPTDGKIVLKAMLRKIQHCVPTPKSANIR